MIEREHQIDIQEVLEDSRLTNYEVDVAREFLIEEMFARLTTTQYLQYLMSYDQQQSRRNSSLKDNRKTQTTSEVCKIQFKKDQIDVPFSVHDSMQSDSFACIKNQSHSYIVENHNPAMRSPAPVQPTKSPFIKIPFKLNSPFLNDSHKINNVSPLVSRNKKH